jgi:hypothetical protein
MAARNCVQPSVGSIAGRVQSFSFLKMTAGPEGGMRQLLSICHPFNIECVWKRLKQYPLVSACQRGGIAV